MSEDVPFWATLPIGRRIEANPTTSAEFGVLRRATPDLLAIARRAWPEARESDFDWDDRKATDRATGEQYRVVTTVAPFYGGNPQDADVSCWCVRDDRLVLLRRRGSESGGTSVHLGEMNASRRIGAEELLRGSGGPRIL